MDSEPSGSCEPTLQLRCERRLTTIETMQSEHGKLLESILVKLDLLKERNESQSVDIAILRTKIMIYGGIGGGIVASIIGVVQAIILQFVLGSSGGR